MQLPISIVIPTFNRQALLVAVLPSYIQQQCSQIIIVDDHSTPPLDETLCRACSPSSNIRVIRNSRRLQQPGSRMAGTAAATEPYILFGEDDVFLEPGFAESLLSYLQSGEFDMVAPRRITIRSHPANLRQIPRGAEASTAAQIVTLGDFTITTKAHPIRPLPVPFLHSNALMQRAAVNAVRFDSHYSGNAFREETDFYLRAGLAGYRMAYVPGPAALHYKGTEAIYGGQHKPGVFSLLWYEYHTARNNYYFLRRFAEDPEYNPYCNHPLWRTAGMMVRRAVHSPARLLGETHSGRKVRSIVIPRGREAQ